MKKINLLNIFLLLATGLYAQYTSFPTGEVIWMVNEYKGILTRSFVYPNADAFYDIRFFYQTGDTVIDKVKYKKISEKVITNFPDYDSAYYGALREDVAAKKVYFRGKDWKQELLLFDFDLKVGDIIKDWYSLDSLPSSSYFKVKKITTGNYTSNSKAPRRIFELEAFGLPNWAFFQSFGNLLYEGIGFETGLFKAPIISDKYKRRLRESCFYDGIVEVSNCEVVSGTEEKNNSHMVLYLHPNPASETLNIGNTKDYQQLSIYHSTGQKVIEIKASESIDVSMLPEGLYLLEAIDSKGYRVVKKFEKR